MAKRSEAHRSIRRPGEGSLNGHVFLARRAPVWSSGEGAP